MKSKDLEAYLEETLSIMKRAGFIVSIISYPEDKRSIDIVGARGSKKTLIKITMNTRDLSSVEYNDLKKAARAYDASPLIISEKTDYGLIEEDIVIKKKGLNIVSIELFKNYLLGKTEPLVYRLQGSYLVRINPVKFRKKREEELGYSLGELAEMIGVTRKAVYEYERGEIDVSIDTAIRIAEIMGEDVFEPIDLLEEKIDPNMVKHDRPRTSFEKTIYSLCDELPIEICEFYKLAKTPIDYVLKLSDNALSIICRDNDEDFETKVSEGSRISSIFKVREYIVGKINDITNLKRELIERVLGGE